MEEIKYPIYYAIEPIYNPINQNCIGHIVSKCFVLEENKKYFEDGSMMVNYKVVFPYQGIDVFGNIKSESIAPTDSNITCVNSIFESYSDAKRESFLKNSHRSEYQRLKLEELEAQIARVTDTLILNCETYKSTDKSKQKSKSLYNSI